MAYDKRASLRAKPGGIDFVFGNSDSDSNVLLPLRQARKLVFPYTPSVSSGNTAEYDEYSFAQSAYKYPSFVKSYPKEIMVSGDFTAQTQTEARYMLAVMHFFKSITKPYFGASSPRAGSPPAIIYFNYLGEQQFYDVPVVVKDYTYTLEPNVDYVLVERFDSYVPAKLNVSIVLETYFNPKQLRDQFDLDEFRKGRLGLEGFL
jgi:hypothetical protein